MNIYIKIALIFFLFSFSAKAEIIKKIEINGNQRVSSETIKIFTEVEINKDLSLNNLNNVIKKIYSTNFFKNVEAKINENILYITVEENPIIQNLKIEGIKNKRILEVLNEQIEMKEKSSFVENRVKNDEKKITNILRTNGYYFSKVVSKLKINDNNTVDLIFDVELGEKAFIKKITFIGDKKIKDNKLRKIIVSEEAKFWKFISSKKFLDINRIKLDEKLLFNYYKNKGYYNVSIESSSAKIINDNDFELIFNINSGQKYYFGKIDLVVPDDYSKESFEQIIKTQKELERQSSHGNDEESVEVVLKKKFKNLEFHPTVEKILIKQFPVKQDIYLKLSKMNLGYPTANKPLKGTKNWKELANVKTGDASTSSMGRVYFKRKTNDAKLYKVFIEVKKDDAHQNQTISLLRGWN